MKRAITRHPVLGSAMRPARGDGDVGGTAKTRGIFRKKSLPKKMASALALSAERVIV